MGQFSLKTCFEAAAQVDGKMASLATPTKLSAKLISLILKIFTAPRYFPATQLDLRTMDHPKSTLAKSLAISVSWYIPKYYVGSFHI